MADVELQAGIAPQATQALGNISQNLMQEALITAQIAAQREGQQLQADTQLQSEEMRLKGFENLNEARQQQLETEIAGRQALEDDRQSFEEKQQQLAIAENERLTRRAMELQAKRNELAGKIALAKQGEVEEKESDLRKQREETIKELKAAERDMIEHETAAGIVNAAKSNTLRGFIDAAASIVDSELQRVEDVYNEMALALTGGQSTLAKGLTQARDDTRFTAPEIIGELLFGGPGRVQEVMTTKEVPLEVGAVRAVTDALNKRMEWSKPNAPGSRQEVRDAAAAFLSAAANASLQDGGDGNMELVQSAWEDYRRLGGDTEKMALVVDRLAKQQLLSMAGIPDEQLSQGSREGFEAASNAFKDMDVLLEGANLQGYSLPAFTFDTPEERKKAAEEYETLVTNGVAALISIYNQENPDIAATIAAQLPKELRDKAITRSLSKEFDRVLTSERAVALADLQNRGLGLADADAERGRIIQARQDAVSERGRLLQEDIITLQQRVPSEAAALFATQESNILDEVFPE